MKEPDVRNSVHLFKKKNICKEIDFKALFKHHSEQLNAKTESWSAGEPDILNHVVCRTYKGWKYRKSAVVFVYDYKNNLFPV